MTLGACWSTETYTISYRKREALRRRSLTGPFLLVGQTGWGRNRGEQA
jgi:hypothetical protein